jgi:iron complex outermembrane receptor protein
MTKRLLRRPTSVIALVLAASAAFGARAQEPPAEAVHGDQDGHENELGTEVEEIVVQATRTGRLLQNEPTRVEVITREEIEEKLLMTPGNISMLLAETGGLRVQVASPSLGASNIRVQGMEGRYTLLLSDGLPLYGGQAASIGLLQIAPTDLGRVEVIKGASSALYGSSALGGVINLVSRRPGEAPGGELLLNATSRDGQDMTAYAAAPFGRGWSGSVVGGLHRQSLQDLDDDGWIDTPEYDRWSLRPRVFWEGESGATAFVTAGLMDESRRGGTAPGGVTPAGQAFVEAQDTVRTDFGFAIERPFGIGLGRLRGSATRQDREHRFGEAAEEDRHETAFLEGSVSGRSETTTWVAGAAFQTDRYRSDTLAGFDYAFETPAVFAQAEHDLSSELVVAGSARLDDHSAYGLQFSPRLSLLYRPGRWTVRASWGRGFYPPTPFVEEIEATGLSRLEPLADLEAETAETASVDVGWRGGPVEAGVTLFAADVDHALRIVEAGPDRVRLVNAPGATRTRGVESLLRWRRGDFTVTGSWVHVDAAEQDETGAGRRPVERTPQNTGGLVAMWERHEVGRIGVEAYYTGRQELRDNPYRSESRPYLELGVLAERVLGNVSVFVNFENILDVRQTKYDRLVRPLRGSDGRWTVDAWAPLEGLVVNGGVRLRFGGR